MITLTMRQKEKLAKIMSNEDLYRVALEHDKGVKDLPNSYEDLEMEMAKKYKII